MNFRAKSERKKTMSRLVNTLLAGSLVIFFSCKSSTLRVDTPIEGISQYDSICVNVTSEVGFQDRRADLEGLILARLETSSSFRRVSRCNDALDHESDLVLDIVIVDLHDVTGEGRAVGGMLAGQASVRVEVKLRDHRTGRVYGACTAEGGSSGVGDTFQALRLVASEIMEFLAGT